MFIVIVYIAITYDNLHILSEDGKPIIFGSEYSAEQTAKELCAWNYKIVKL